jgi:hypothetical protein
MELSQLCLSSILFPFLLRAFCPTISCGTIDPYKYVENSACLSFVLLCLQTG